MSNINTSDDCGVVFVDPTETESVTSTSASVTQPELCTCTCGNSRKVNKSVKIAKRSTRSCENKKICFNFGTACHITRTCSTRMFVNSSTLRKENESRGRSLTRKSSRSLLREDDWKIHNNEKKANPKLNR